MNREITSVYYIQERLIIARIRYLDSVKRLKISKLCGRRGKTKIMRIMKILSFVLFIRERMSFSSSLIVKYLMLVHSVHTRGPWKKSHNWRHRLQFCCNKLKQQQKDCQRAKACHYYNSSDLLEDLLSGPVYELCVSGGLDFCIFIPDARSFL